MADINSLLSEIAGLAGESSRPLEWNEIAGASESSAPLSPIEKVLGYSRSYLAGPTFGFGDNLEALVSSVLTGKTSDQELSAIRDQQKRFKDKTDYLDNAVELASGAILNPLSELRAAKVARDIPAISSLMNLGTSVPVQAALTGAGNADGKDVLENAAKAAVIGTGFSALGSVAGNVLEKTARNADRFKLSAYGIGAADLNRSLRKVGDEADRLGSAENIPIVSALKNAEKNGIVDVSNDALTNASNIRGVQNGISAKLTKLLETADKKIAPRVDFGFDNVIDYLSKLSGTAQEKAAAAVDAELSAILPQLGKGSLQDLQRVKIGLNYKFDENPYVDDIIKALRSDLRAEIEKRVNDAATSGVLPNQLAGSVRSLNSKWGELAELKDAFVRRGAKDIQGNPVEDIVRGGATTGGVGSMNIAAAQTGNPLYTAIGAGLSAARAPEALNAVADILSDPALKVPIQAIGKALPEVVTGRNVAGVRDALRNGPEENKAVSAESIQSLLSEIQKLSGVSTEKKTEKQSAINSDMFKKVSNEIDSDLVRRVIRQESKGNPNAVSPKGAQGLMQLMPATGREMAKKLGVVYNPFDPEQNVMLGSAYLQEQLNKYDGNEAYALAAYNMGPNAFDDALKGKRRIPKETRDYVEQILGDPLVIA